MASFMEAKVGLSMILFTRPDYDPATRYLSAWSGILIQEAQEKTIDVLDLQGEKANKKELEGRLKKKRPSLVVLNGHGNDYCVTGQDEAPLVQVGDNADVLAGTVTYAVSCNSASKLGREVGDIPETAYIGYEKKFAFLQSHGYFKQPEKDPWQSRLWSFPIRLYAVYLKDTTLRKVLLVQEKRERRTYVVWNRVYQIRIHK